MGGAVISFMDMRHERTKVPNERALEFEKHTLKYRNFLRAHDSNDNASAAGSSPVYRFSRARDADYDDIQKSYHSTTFLQSFHRLCRERTTSDMCAYRPIDHVATEEIVDETTGKSKKMEITYLAPTVRLTYGEVWSRIDAFGRGLAKLGVRPQSNVAIYLDTCVEWFTGIYGIWSQGVVAATVYANLGESALAYALNETEAAAILCGSTNARNLVKLMRDGVIPRVPVVYVGTLPTTLDTAGVELISFEEVLRIGRQEAKNGASAGRPSTNNDDLALIMYTSGTTGDPKGVMHTHGSLVAGATSLSFRVEDILGKPNSDETYVSFLPMAHIMEFTVTNILIQRGALIGFGSPRTLTDMTARPHGDLTEYKPSLLVGVPRIFDTLKKGIEAKLPPPGTLKRRVFDHAFQSRLKALKEGYDTPFWNEKVFAATRKLVGGRVRACLSGGGPISAATQEFINVVLAPCVGGYGLTETVCVGGIQMIGDWATECIGLIEPGEEIKLLDTEYYKHTDKPEPRGELLQRGAHLFKGYYKQPELTAEAIDKDGWFHTGDVASITANGKLRIVGRVKALAKNSLGEYVAMETLEAIYGNNPLLLPNGVCVLVHPNRNYIAAIAVTEESKAKAFATEHGIKGEWPAILKNPEFQKAAAKSLAQTARDAKRQSFECVRHVRVVSDEWTPENDILTAAMKLKRRVIDVKYAKTINELFAEE